MSPFVPEKKNLAHIPRHTSTRERASWNSIRYSNPGQTSLPEISIVSKISIELRRQRKLPPLLHRYNIGGRGSRWKTAEREKKKREGRGKFAGAHNQRMKPVNFQFLHFFIARAFRSGDNPPVRTSIGSSDTSIVKTSSLSVLYLLLQLTDNQVSSMQCIALIGLIGYVHFSDHRLSSFPKMEETWFEEREFREGIWIRAHTRYHGEGRDVYWIIIGRTVRLYRFPDANEPFCTNVLGATWTWLPLFVALFEFVINAVICDRILGLGDYLDLVAYGVSFQSIVEWMMCISLFLLWNLVYTIFFSREIVKC